MAGSRIKLLNRREIGALATELTGTIITAPHVIDFDGASAGVWVADVEIGSNHYLKDIPVKANSNRFYAQLGQVVTLRKNSQGRFEVIGPGDKKSNPVVVKYYQIGVTSAVSTINKGFAFDRVAFSYYATLAGGAPLGVIWNDGVTPFSYVRLVDAYGAPI